MSKISTTSAILFLLVSACGRPEAIPPARTEAPVASLALQPEVAEGAADGQVFEYY